MQTKTVVEIKIFLRHLNIPKLPEGKSKLCEENLTKKHLYDSLKNMQNDKSPRDDGLTIPIWKNLYFPN